MIFYRQGTKKPSNEPDMVSGCLLIVAFGAIFFLLSMLESWDDLKEYFFQIILALFIGVGFIASMFQKKGHISNQNIIIKNGKLKFEKVKVPLETISLVVFKKGDQFQRYFVRDEKVLIAIFSIFQDDLLNYFTEKIPEKITSIQEESHKHDGPYVSVWSADQNLYYNLDTGSYTLKINNTKEISHLPEVYTYDPKYKLGKPLFKKS